VPTGSFLQVIGPSENDYIILDVNYTVTWVARGHVQCEFVPGSDFAFQCRFV
jgi:hypothetical protein